MRRSVISSAYLRAVIIVSVTLAVIAALPGLLHLQFANADPAAGGVENFGITLRAVQNNDDGTEKTEYLSGEPFHVDARFRASEADFQAHPGGFLLRLTIPRSEYFLQEPNVVDPSVGLTSRPHTPTDYVYEYTFTDPTALDVTIRAGLAFKNGDTPNGTSVTPKIELKSLDGANEDVRPPLNQTYVALSSSDFTPVKTAQIRQWQGDEVRNIPGVGEVLVAKNSRFSNGAPGVIGTGQRITYSLGLKFNHDKQSNPHGYGMYLPKKIRLIDTLPPGARTQTSAYITESWQNLPGAAENVYYVDINNPYQRPSLLSDGYLKTMEASFDGLASNLDGNSINVIHENRLQVIADPDGMNIDLGSVSHHTAFVDHEVPQPPEFNQALDIYKNDALGSMTSLLVSDGQLYMIKESGCGGYNCPPDKARLVDPDTPEDGLKWSVVLMHDSTNYIPEYGHYVDEIVDRIPRGLRASALKVTYDHQTPEESKDRLRDAFNAAEFALYGRTAPVVNDVRDRGVTTDGYELIKDYVTFEELIGISDPTGRYSEIKLVARTPMKLNRTRLRLEVTTKLTSQELLAANSNTEWAMGQHRYYTNDSYMWWRTDIASQDYHMHSDDASKGVQKTKIFGSLQAATPRPALVYQNCEANASIVPPYTPDNCARIAAVYVDLEVARWPAMNAPFAAKLQQPRVIAVLPPGFSFLDPLPGMIPADITFERIPNYKDSGRDAVVFSRDELAYSESDRAFDFGKSLFKFHVDASKAANFGENIVEIYTAWNNLDEVPNSTPPGTFNFFFEDISQWGNQSVFNEETNDRYDVDNDGDTAEQITRGRVVFNVQPPIETTARKSVAVSHQGDPVGADIPADRWHVSSRAIDADFDGTLNYRLQVRFGQNNITNRLTLIDALPQVNDHMMVTSGNSLGTQPRIWTSTDSDLSSITGNSSAFATPLKNKVSTIQLVNGQNVEDARQSFEVFYSYATQGARLSDLTAAQWIPETEPVNLQDVKAIKVVMKPGVSVPQNAVLNIYTEHTLAFFPGTDKSLLRSGSKAVNSFVMTTDNGASYQETNPVESLFVKYKVRGNSFRDANSDGLYSGGTDGRGVALKVSVVDDGGNVVIQDGQPLEKFVTSASANDDWDYEFDIYKRGTYKLRFEKQSVQTFTTTHAFYERPDANHAYGCGVNEVDVSGGDPSKCEEAHAESNNYAWTKPFTFTPSVRIYERNVGIRAHATGTLTWQKVSQQVTSNRFLSDSEWTLVKGADSWVIKDCVITTQDPGIACSPELKDTDPAAGKFSVTNLAPGEYTLTERKAPAGYIIDPTERKKTISGGEVVDFGEIVNNLRPSVTIPLTGGMGADTFLVTGGGVLLLGLIGTIHMTRRNRAY